MNIVEKRDFIHSHLHIADDGLINELYLKIQSKIKGKQMMQVLMQKVERFQ